jgi:hypothetical protein
MMRAPRVALALALCAALAAAAWLACRRLADAAPLLALARGAAEAERLDKAYAVCEARRHFKEGLARDLLCGRLPLAEAIRRFRDHLDAEAPPEGGESAWYGRGVLRAVEGDSDAERLGRSLILEVRAGFAGPPSATREAAARLERELAEHLHGKGPTPDWP